jgi:NitT/TauT family transport system permease protein
VLKVGSVAILAGGKTMNNPSYLSLGNTARAFVPNRWDLVALVVIMGGLAMAAVGLHQAQVPLETIQQATVTLDPSNLPDYALRTTLRMLGAMVGSLVFTFIYGALAAKSRHLELVLIPILDILQSVPVLGYISFTVVFFMSLFPGQVLGAELACMFAIWTSQVWNMTFSFYQSLRTLPLDLDEASRSFRFSPWQRFWRLEVPFSMPGLIWNMMMSMSGGWFFVVASEAITVGDNTITLPGIGAYVATAIQEKNLGAVGWGLVTMTVVILLYDLLLFRPLVAWSDKFRSELTAGQLVPESFFLDVIRRTRFLGAITQPISRAFRATLRLRLPAKPASLPRIPVPKLLVDWVWYVVVAAGAVWCGWQLVEYVSASLGWSEVFLTAQLTLFTMIRVLVLIVLASLVWVPLGVWIGLRPAWTAKVQPLAQFLAAFPANLMFPVAVVMIVKYSLNAEVWVGPLMILGTQWYILFNVIAGTSAFPNDLKEAAVNFRIRKWQWWRTVMLPGIFPYFVTGAITASGGAWNASIVAEYMKWGDSTITASGIGSYIARMTEAGDYPRIVLGIAVMSLFVTVFNRLLWRRLYTYAANRMRLD